jgi:hypothetical protein
MTNIYNLFKFLEDKEGKTLSPDRLLKVKLAHAPEKLRPEDLNIEGSLQVNTGTTQLPDNLNVKGDLSLTTAATTLPKNLQVGGDFRLYGDKIKELPADLKANRLNIESNSLTSLPNNFKIPGSLLLTTPKLTALPSTLEVGGNLVIVDSSITTLPDSLEVKGYIDISRAADITPASIPERLRDKIRWNGGTFEDLNAYVNLPTITVPGIGKDVKGRKVTIKTAKDIPDFTGLNTDLPELANLLAKQPIKNLEIYNVYQPGYGGRIKTETQISVKLPDLPLPLVLTYENDYVTRGEIKYKSKSLKMNTFETELKNRGLEVALGRLIPGYIKQAVPKQIQNEKGKALRLSQIIDRDQEPVSMDLGNKKRGGLGVKGQYKDYALAFSPEAQNNLINVGKQLGVEWKDFVAYRHNDVGDANYVVRGEAPNGDVYYLNRFGTGQGGGTRVYDKNFNWI